MLIAQQVDQLNLGLCRDPVGRAAGDGAGDLAACYRLPGVAKPPG